MNQNSSNNDDYFALKNNSEDYNRVGNKDMLGNDMRKREDCWKHGKFLCIALTLLDTEKTNTNPIDDRDNKGSQKSWREIKNDESGNILSENPKNNTVYHYWKKA